MAGASSSGEAALYSVPAVQRPSIEQLRSAAEALNLHISTDELQQYRSSLLISFLLDLTAIVFKE